MTMGVFGVFGKKVLVLCVLLLLLKGFHCREIMLDELVRVECCCRNSDGRVECLQCDIKTERFLVASGWLGD